MFKAKSGKSGVKRPQGTSPLRAIRLNCIDCCCGSAKAAKWCTCDGVNSTRCHLWPFRFGKRPKTAAKKYGDRLLDPRQMPSASISLDDVKSDIKDEGRPADRSEGLSQKKCAGAHVADAPEHAGGQEETP